MHKIFIKLSFSILRTFKNKMVQKSQSTVINIMANKKKNFNNKLNLSFLNVKGLQTYKKHVKMIEYFKNKICHTGILFL